jgi:hypothetical protein
MGETGQEEGSADLSPAERICQEWHTLDLQAKQESEAPQGKPWSSWREKIKHRTEFGQRRLMALAPKGANLRKGVNKKGARFVPLFYPGSVATICGVEPVISVFSAFLARSTRCGKFNPRASYP